MHMTKTDRLYAVEEASRRGLANEKHYSKENNTSENAISSRKIFKSVHYVKYEGQVRSQYLLFVQLS